MTTQSLYSPKWLKPGEGTVIEVLGNTHTFKITGNDTGGSFAVVEIETPPGGGPPLHRHSWEDEWFCILKGEFEFQVDQDRIRASEGSYLFAPRSIPHRFQNVGRESGLLQVTLTPAGFESFFEELAKLGREEQRDGSRIAELGAKYGMDFIR